MDKMNMLPAHHFLQSIAPNCAKPNCLANQVLACVRVLTLTVIAALLMFSPTGAAAQTSNVAPKSQDSPAGNAENGKEAFASRNCSVCHGSEGQGAAGPRIGPPGRLFPDFVRYVRQPTNQMPPYTSKVVSDSDLADIYAFLQSIPMPPSAKSIPLLNQ